jgi:hypothetical protein
MSNSLIGTGYNATISYVAESSFGTAPTTYTMIEIGRVTSTDLSIGSEHLSVYGLDTQTRVMQPQGNETYELGVEFYMNDVAWTFIQEIDDQESFQFVITQSLGGTDQYTVLSGGTIKEISISGSAGEAWTCSATIGCKQIVNDEITTTQPANWTAYTRSTDEILMCHGGKLASGAGWITGASADLPEVTDVEISHSYSHTDNYVLNENVVEGFYEGNIEVSFSFTCNFINLEQFQRILDDESGSLVLWLEDTGYNVTLANCVYDEISYPLSEGELTNIEISGTASTWAHADS